MFGFRVPDVVATAVDQAGLAQSASRCMTQRSITHAQQRPNGHPKQTAGQSRAAAKFNLRARYVGSGLLRRRNAGRCTYEAFGRSTQHNNVGLAWLRTACSGTAPDGADEVWSALGAYEHIWNPKWRTADQWAT